MTKTSKIGKNVSAKAAVKKKPARTAAARKTVAVKQTASKQKSAKVANASKPKVRKGKASAAAAPIVSTASDGFKSSKPSGYATKAAKTADTSKPSFFRRPAAVLALVILIVASVLIVRAVTADKNQPISQDAYQKQLQSQVETSNGTPATGRDPAGQQQNSLADAASRPTGVGNRTTTTTPPPASTSGSGSSEHGGHYVGTTNDPKQSGIGSNGCYIDYGVQGEQCLPAHAATNGTLACEGVRKHFAKGIAVTGTDRFNLDKNGDKIACNSGD